jgi:hypothetical protein
MIKKLYFPVEYFNINELECSRLNIFVGNSFWGHRYIHEILLRNRVNIILNTRNFPEHDEPALETIVEKLQSKNYENILFYFSEANLYPTYQYDLAYRISETIKTDANKQVFICTNSCYIFDRLIEECEWIDLKVNLIWRKWKTNTDHITQLKEKDLSNLIATGSDIFFNIHKYISKKDAIEY